MFTGRICYISSPFRRRYCDASWLFGIDGAVLRKALTALAAFDERKSRVVEMRFFAGLGVEETAEALAVSPETVKRDWRIARLWLRRELDHEKDHDP